MHTCAKSWTDIGKQSDGCVGRERQRNRKPLRDRQTGRNNGRYSYNEIKEKSCASKRILQGPVCNRIEEMESWIYSCQSKLKTFKGTGVCLSLNRGAKRGE